MLDAETLRTYAKIFRKPRRVDRDGALLPTTEICIAAAEALEFQAEAIENRAKGKYEDMV